MSYKVLIMNNNEYFCSILENFLSQLPFIHAECFAQNRESSIEFIKNFQPDTILMDMDIYQAKTRDFCQSLKQVKPNPSIIIMTDYREQENLIHMPKDLIYIAVDKCSLFEKLPDLIHNLQSAKNH